MNHYSPASAVPTDSVQLSNGGRMPLLGFGTWQLTGRSAHDSVRIALEVGYRHIDTATMYGNQRSVGAALMESGLPRDDVFITSKLAPERFGRYGLDLRIGGRRPRPALEQSLEQLGVPHLDLWLMHWPPRSGVGAPLWEQFLAARDEGLVRDIGVSNYSLDQIDELVARTGAAPTVNQIRWSPSTFDRALLDGHRKRGVTLEGYSGLNNGTLKDPTVVQLAERSGHTPAQVVIRWHLYHAVVVLPRSRDPEHIRTNAAVGRFRLTETDQAALDALGR